MQTYLFTMKSPPEGFEETVSAAFPDQSFPLFGGSNSWIIRGKDLTTREVAVKLKLQAPEDQNNTPPPSHYMVVAFNNYWGWASNDTWEWLRQRPDS